MISYKTENFKPGDKVSVKYSDGVRYNATVTRVTSVSSADIVWDTGEYTSSVQMRRFTMIRKVKAATAADATTAAARLCIPAAATKQRESTSARTAARELHTCTTAARKRKGAPARMAARLRTPAAPAKKRKGMPARVAARPCTSATAKQRKGAAAKGPTTKATTTLKTSSRDTVTKSLREIYHPKSSPHTLVLGTHPSKVSLGMRTLSARDIQRRGGDGKQNYGNVRNCFWNIAGSALGFRRDKTPYSEQIHRFAEAGLILWDVVETCSYRGDSSLDSRINLNTIVPNDIDRLLAQCPSIKRIAFAQTSAAFFCKEQCFRHLLLGGEAARHAWQAAGFKQVPALVVRRGSAAARKVFFKASYQAVTELGEDEIAAAQDNDSAVGRTIELVVLPSTSPANAGNRALKEKQWHQAVYFPGATQPPPHYMCAACQAAGHHWLADCTHQGGFAAWKQERRKIKAKDDKDEDGLRWYL